MKEFITKAKMVALLAHDGQRYGNHPYSYHLGGVVDLVTRYYADDSNLRDLIQIGWLHDSIEDTRVSEDDLRKLGFSESVISAVIAMTRLETETYNDYIERLLSNALAVKVKRADSLFNYLESKKQGNKGLMKRYTKVLTKLSIEHSPLSTAWSE